MNRIELKKQAKSLIKGNLWILWKASLTMGLFMSGVNYILSFFFPKFDVQMLQTIKTLEELQPIIDSLIIKASISDILSSIFAVGFIAYVLKFIRNEQPDIKEIWSHYPKTVTILITAFLVFLLTGVGFILFIIPGIIISFGLAMNQYIIADTNESVSPILVVKKSWEIMKGHKMEYFMLNLSFFGWFVLCVFTFGLLIIYVFPYFITTQALFYNQLLGENNGVEPLPINNSSIQNNESSTNNQNIQKESEKVNNIFPND